MVPLLTALSHNRTILRRILGIGKGHSARGKVTLFALVSNPSNHAIQRNNVRVSGRGRQAMVFAHGFGCDQNMWRFVAPAFERRLPGRAVRPRRARADRTCRAYDRDEVRDAATATPTTCSRSAASSTCSDVVFVGHSVSAMIGVLAAIRGAGAVRRAGAGRPVAALRRTTATTSAGSAGQDIDGLLDSLDSNHLGWSSAMAPVIMGNPDRPELGDGADQQLLPHRSGRSPGSSPGSRSCPTTAPTSPKVRRPDAGPAVLART